MSQIGSAPCTTAIASFSSAGPLIWNGVDIQKPDISAPGVAICAAKLPGSFSGFGTCYDSQHVAISGTSMATAETAGAVAIALQAHPTYTPAQIKTLLKTTSTSLGLSYNVQGSGEINVSSSTGATTTLVISSSTWSIATTPTSRYSTSTQLFSVSPLDSHAGSTTLTISFNTLIPGITASTTKTLITISSSTAATFTATIVADNNVAVAGIYTSSIILSQAGIPKGIIPLSFTVTPTLSVVSTSTIDYGVDSYATSTWTSATSTIVISNLRSDIPQTISITSPHFSVNTIQLNASSSLTIASSSNESLSTTLTAHNQDLPAQIFDSVMYVTNSLNSLSLSAAFTNPATVIAPTVVASTTTAVTQTSATLSAVLTVDGGASSTLRGFYWGTALPYSATTSVAGVFGTSTFSTDLSTLSCGTTYHWSAYATNYAHTGTSTDQTFTTTACPIVSSGGGGGGSSSSGGGGGGGVSAVPIVVPPAYTASSTPVCPTGYACINAVPHTPIFTRNLTIGSTGDDVTALQTLLASLGLLSTSPTGYFGPKTAKAVADYQTLHKLPAVGSVGPLTKTFLNSAAAQQAPTTFIQNTIPSIPTPVHTTDLILGMTSADVLSLQLYLNTHGSVIASSGAGSPGNETTYFGSRTQLALIHFQSTHVLPSTGTLSSSTRDYIQSHP